MRIERSSISSVLSAALLLVACGADDEPAKGNTPPQDAGMDQVADQQSDGQEDVSDTGQGDVVEAGDAGEAGEDTGDAQADAPDPLTSNTIFVTTGVFNAGSTTNITVMATAAAPGERCHVKKVGTCFYYECRPKTPLDPEPAWLSAGTVTVRKGNEILLESVPDADNKYPSAYLSAELWSPGDDISLSASGDDIPAFTQEFVGPSAVTLLSPLPGTSGFIDIDRTAALDVTWEPVAGGVTVTCSQTEGSGFARQGRFICEFDGSTGAGTVPSEALAVLKTSDQSPNTAFNIGGNVVADILPGGYNVHAYAVFANTLQAKVMDGN